MPPLQGSIWAKSQVLYVCCSASNSTSYTPCIAPIRLPSPTPSPLAWFDGGFRRLPSSSCVLILWQHHQTSKGHTTRWKMGLCNLKGGYACQIHFGWCIPNSLTDVPFSAHLHQMTPAATCSVYSPYVLLRFTFTFTHIHSFFHSFVLVWLSLTAPTFVGTCACIVASPHIY